MKSFCLLLIMLLSSLSYACFNEYYGVDKEGKLILLGDTWKTVSIYKNFNSNKEAAKLVQFEKQLHKQRNYMLLSDYAVVLTRLGKTKEALRIMKVLYKHYPTEYRIVANLGTAYELSGQPDSALKYIRINLKLNPADHQGSEWVHVKILEAKLAIRKDPQWLKKNSVLQLNEKQKGDLAVLQHILIQLKERVPFAPAPDELVGNLFIDMGDISARIGTIAYARAYYRIAKDYYGVVDSALDNRIGKMNALLKKYSSVEPKMTGDEKGRKQKVECIGVNDILYENTYEGEMKMPVINTNVPALLAMVDFAKTPSQIRDSISANKNVMDELTLIPDAHDDSIAKAVSNDSLKSKAPQESDKSSAVPPEGSSQWIYIAIGLLIFTVSGILLFVRKKK